MRTLAQTHEAGTQAGKIIFRNVLLPTDFSPASLAALPHAAAIAKRFSSQVYVAHAFLPPSYPNIPAALAGSVLRHEQQTARHEMDEFLRREEISGLEPKGIFLMGSTVEALLQVIREKEIDLVVMATHGRTGFRRLALGSVTEAVVRHSPCPVLTVPIVPEGPQQ